MWIGNLSNSLIYIFKDLRVRNSFDPCSELENNFKCVDLLNYIHTYIPTKNNR